MTTTEEVIVKQERRIKALEEELQGYREAEEKRRAANTARVKKYRENKKAASGGSPD